jgi:AcrR family transcriptional regulator
VACVTKRRPYAARVPIEVRREQLLDAAIRVIVRDGYDGVSVEAIAREAGVTRPVVYGAFDGLGPLLSALLDRQQARALEQLATAFPVDAADPAEAILAAVRTMAERVRSEPLTWQPILAAPQATPDAVRRRIDGDRELVRDYLRGLLAGVLPTDVDVELAAHALVATLEYFGRVLVEDPDRFEPDRLVEFARGLLRLGQHSPA